MRIHPFLEWPFASTDALQRAFDILDRQVHRLFFIRNDSVPRECEQFGTVVSYENLYVLPYLGRTVVWEPTIGHPAIKGLPDTGNPAENQPRPQVASGTADMTVAVVPKHPASMAEHLAEESSPVVTLKMFDQSHADAFAWPF